MSESTVRKSGHERYEFTWSTNGSAKQAAPASVPTVNPEGYSPDPSDVNASPDMALAQPVDQIADMLQEDEEATRSEVPTFDERSLRTFRSSPKSRGRFSFSFGSSTGPGSTQLKLVAIGGWSCVAATGAVFLMMGPGPFPGVRLAELGGVWGAISALVWFLPGKLIK